MIRIFHLNALTDAQAARLNIVGWDGAPEFSRYADITSFGDLEAVKAAWGDAGYALVGTVATDDLDVAYEKTNHIVRNWTENDGVRADSAHVRSSSIGDVFERDGKFHVVASAGFEAIDLK